MLKAGYLLLASLMVLVLTVTQSWSKGPANVSNTVHNLSVTAPLIMGFQIYGSNETQICIFCHTPHGGSLDGPLWNRSNPNPGSFTHYNSITLSTAIQTLGAKRPINDESLLCMACHDGSISVMHLINPSNDLGANPTSVFTSNSEVFIVETFGSAKIGGSSTNPSAYGDLSDDHPISFSYSGVLGSNEYTTGAKVGRLHTAELAQGKGVRFFGPENRMECSSCHDPHVDYTSTGNTAYDPFLITPNSGSALCLACHNK